MPPLKTTIGRLLVNEALPVEFRDYDRQLDGKGLRALLERVAHENPDAYREISHKLLKMGEEEAYRFGGYSFGIEDLRKSDTTKQEITGLKQKAIAIINNDHLSEDEREQALTQLMTHDVGDRQERVFQEALAKGNPIARQVLSGSRGKKFNVSSLISSDSMYEDHKGRPVPVPVFRSYSEGLSPAEFMAGTFGARRGVLDAKSCVSGDTLVLMADRTAKRIDQIEPGEVVFGSDTRGQMRPVTVVRRFDNGAKPCFKWTFRSGSAQPSAVLIATEDHQVLAGKVYGRTGGADKPALLALREFGPDSFLCASGYAFWSNGSERPAWFTFLSTEPVGEIETFDIEVDHPDHMFVLANGLVISNSTAQAGYFGKQLAQVAHRMVVTADDDDEEGPTPTSIRGLPVDTDDADNVGAVLAQAAGGIPRNTILDARMLKKLKEKGLTKILVRSPTVGGPPQGGVYARDVGVREKGFLPPIGSVVGMTAAQALGEPVAQSMLSSKHSGGIAGATAGAVTGFTRLESAIQVPKTFPGGMTHAQVDGRVDSIRENPAGGFYISVGGVEHYVPHGLDLARRVGDRVESGDPLSAGFPNPAELVAHKGIGEGRRQFVRLMRQAYRDADVVSNRRNIELLSRALIDHVDLTDEVGGFLPDDTVSYSALERSWKPREGAELKNPRQAVGRYLEAPILHHTIGTKIQPSMLDEMDQFGVKEVLTHAEPAPFQPRMVRAMANLRHDPEWMPRMYGSGLEKSLLDATHRGLSTDSKGTSFVPSLARAVDFGREGLFQDFGKESPPPRDTIQ